MLLIPSLISMAVVSNPALMFAIYSQLLVSLPSGCACSSTRVKPTLLTLAASVTILEYQHLALPLDAPKAHCEKVMNVGLSTDGEGRI